MCIISLYSSHVIDVILGFVFPFPAQHRQRYLSPHTYTHAQTDRHTDRDRPRACRRICIDEVCFLNGPPVAPGCGCGCVCVFGSWIFLIPDRFKKEKTYKLCVTFFTFMIDLYLASFLSVIYISDENTIMCVIDSTTLH